MMTTDIEALKKYAHKTIKENASLSPEYFGFEAADWLIDHLSQNYHIVPKDCVVIPKSELPEGLDNAEFILTNAMAEKYPLGTDFGRFNDEITTLIQTAQAVLEAAEESDNE